MQAFGFGTARGARRQLLGLTVPGNPVALLAPLSFSSSSLTVGTSASGSIVGATAGSTVAATGLPAGLTIAGAARTWAYSGGGSAGSSTITLTETLAGSANSPRGSSITVTIAAAPANPTLGTLSLSGALRIGTAASGTIAGATAGSTIAGSVPGITINSANRTYGGTPTGSAQTIANGLVETLAGASGSPRSSAVTVGAASGAGWQDSATWNDNNFWDDAA